MPAPWDEDTNWAPPLPAGSNGTIAQMARTTGRPAPADWWAL
jgi:hypothetical protein